MWSSTVKRRGTVRLGSAEEPVLTGPYGVERRIRCASTSRPPPPSLVSTSPKVFGVRFADDDDHHRPRPAPHDPHQRSALVVIDLAHDRPVGGQGQPVALERPEILVSERRTGLRTLRPWHRRASSAEVPLCLLLVAKPDFLRTDAGLRGEVVAGFEDRPSLRRPAKPVHNRLIGTDRGRGLTPHQRRHRPDAPLICRLRYDRSTAEH